MSSSAGPASEGARALGPASTAPSGFPTAGQCWKEVPLCPDAQARHPLPAHTCAAAVKSGPGVEHAHRWPPDGHSQPPTHTALVLGWGGCTTTTQQITRSRNPRLPYPAQPIGTYTDSAPRCVPAADPMGLHGPGNCTTGGGPQLNLNVTLSGGCNTQNTPSRRDKQLRPLPRQGIETKPLPSHRRHAAASEIPLPMFRMGSCASTQKEPSRMRTHGSTQTHGSNPTPVSHCSGYRRDSELPADLPTACEAFR